MPTRQFELSLEIKYSDEFGVVETELGGRALLGDANKCSITVVGSRDWPSTPSSTREEVKDVYYGAQTQKETSEAPVVSALQSEGAQRVVLCSTRLMLS